MKFVIVFFLLFGIVGSSWTPGWQHNFPAEVINYPSAQKLCEKNRIFQLVCPKPGGGDDIITHTHTHPIGILGKLHRDVCLGGGGGGKVALSAVYDSRDCQSCPCPMRSAVV